MKSPDDNWIENMKLVEYQLRQLSGLVEKLDKAVDALNVKIARLEVKAGIWGVIGSALVAIPTAIAVWLSFGR